MKAMLKLKKGLLLRTERLRVKHIVRIGKNGGHCCHQFQQLLQNIEFRETTES